jgi:ribosomal protein S18 acetylase RimI-like enzyme
MGQAIAHDPTIAFGWKHAAKAGLTFRRICDADLPILARVYASTRTEELAPVPWSDDQKGLFLDSQFRAQHQHYQQHYPTADWLMIMRADQVVGRLYIDRWQREHRVIDIALLPEYRGRGLGSAVIRDLLDEAAAVRKTLSIHVEKANRAQLFYARLGFQKVGDQGAYDLMEAQPG